jgi:hypothetical protein
MFEVHWSTSVQFLVGGYFAGIFLLSPILHSLMLVGMGLSLLLQKRHPVIAKIPFSFAFPFCFLCGWLGLLFWLESWLFRRTPA